MGTHFKQGFTIIETMLVLAITGVLIASLIVGVGGTVNAQRYKDSVNSLQVLLQDQYAQVDNVTNVNDRSVKWSCDGAAATAQSDNANAKAPGQSDCVLLGRLVTISNDQIATAAVVGIQKSETKTTSDVADLKTNYTFGVSQSSIETTTLEWGAAIAWPTTGIDAKTGVRDRTFAMLVVRSPESGATYTFTSDSDTAMNAVNSSTLSSMMVASNSVPGQAQRFLCVDPSPGTNGLTVPEKLSVMVDQAASAPSGIETRTQSINQGLRQDSSCN